MRDLREANDLAGGAGGFLSPPRRSTAGLGNWPGYCASRLGERRSDRAAAQTALPRHRLVLVPRDAPACNWIDSGGLTGARRSIHLFAPDRSLLVASVGNYGRLNFPVRHRTNPPWWTSAQNSGSDGFPRHYRISLVRSRPGFPLAQR